MLISLVVIEKKYYQWNNEKEKNEQHNAKS